MNLFLIVSVIVGIILSIVNIYISISAKYTKNTTTGSGIPIIGSFILVISLLFIENKLIFAIVVFFTIFDTAGIHWLIGMMIYRNLNNHKCGKKG